MLHDFVEDYPNDIVIKSKEVSQHVDNLKVQMIELENEFKMSLWCFFWEVVGIHRSPPRN